MKPYYLSKKMYSARPNTLLPFVLINKVIRFFIVSRYYY